MSLADIYKKIKPAVVAIALVEEKDTEVSFDKIFGTGFCVDPNGIIVTARHIISGYYEEIRKEVLPKSHHDESKPLHHPDFKIIFFRKGSDGFEAISTPVINFIFPLIGDHPEDDVAVLRIPKCPEIFGAEYPFVAVGGLSIAREGDDVAIAGYPLKAGYKESRMADLNRGIISRIDEKIGADKKWKVTKLVLDITANPGNSGGPAFHVKSGNVLGLVSAEKLSGLPNIPDEHRGIFQIPSGMLYCIPATIINGAISALKDAEQKQP